MMSDRDYTLIIDKSGSMSTPTKWAVEVDGDCPRVYTRFGKKGRTV